MTHEEVFVVPRAAIADAAGWYGIRTDDLDAFVEALEREGRFGPRPAMEVDPSFKQIIPYLVLRDAERYFLMRRTKAGADARLHDRYSIGVGGHINPEDGDVDGGLRREWQEEIDADFVPDFRPLGLLNDDDNAVGAVHLGLVYEADTGGRPVAIRELDKLEGRFATVEEVAAVADRLETWSALLFDYLEQSRSGDAAGA
jgi:predicted NUDIX family phosphoesterase